MRNPGVVPGGGVSGSESKLIDVIRSELSEEQFHGYLMGNIIK